jgi:NAD(P)-dependent dehydrogenase (short-subunit alcohol dehydrogenase family)
MRPLDEQVILVTGATDGLGRGVAHRLAGTGATVLVHGRDDGRGAATIDAIGEATGNDRLRWYRAVPMPRPATPRPAGAYANCPTASWGS